MSSFIIALACWPLQPATQHRIPVSRHFRPGTRHRGSGHYVP